MSFEIIATVGPNCATPNSIRTLVEAGVTAFRLPLAKESLEWHASKATLIQAVAEDIGQRVKRFADLPGTQPRLGNVNPVEVSDGDLIWLTSSLVDTLDRRQIKVSPWPWRSYQAGSVLIVGDGEVALLVTATEPYRMECKVLFGGIIRQRRGLTREGGGGEFETIGKREHQLLRFAKEQSLEGVLLSFVDDPASVESARAIMGADCEVLSKIETHAGVRNLNSIARVSDAVILGRGDLALQVGRVEFPEVENRIVKEAVASGYRLIVGTHLLESASTSWIPYRSELSSLAAFLKAGIDGALLSSETTIGARPPQVVRVLCELVDRYWTQKP